MLKNLFSFGLLFLLLITFTSCDSKPSSEDIILNNSNEQITYGSFDYNKEYETYVKDEYSIKTGFKNINETKIDSANDAIELAKNEIKSFDYNEITANYDKSTCKWSITFSTKDTVGGCCTIFINEKGKTELIVYGE